MRLQLIRAPYLSRILGELKGNLLDYVCRVIRKVSIVVPFLGLPYRILTKNIWLNQKKELQWRVKVVPRKGSSATEISCMSSGSRETSFATLNIGLRGLGGSS